MEITTDYLEIGAGASGLAFADALLADAGADVDVTFVDRKSAPGGHWLDAYPFVRLHSPSAYYGAILGRWARTESTRRGRTTFRTGCYAAA